MPRSSSLAITIVHTAPADLDELRVLVHAAIDAVNHQAGLEGAVDPFGPAAEARKPDRGAVPGPGPGGPGDRS